MSPSVKTQCIFLSFEYRPYIFKLSTLPQTSLPIHMLRGEGHKRSEGSRCADERGKTTTGAFQCVNLCVCVFIDCPNIHTLTLAWAATLCSCWLLACLRSSSRSARRAAQQEVNPSFSSSRARTTCRSSSCLLHSVFIC